MHLGTGLGRGRGVYMVWITVGSSLKDCKESMRSFGSGVTRHMYLPINTPTASWYSTLESVPAASCAFMVACTSGGSWARSSRRASAWRASGTCQLKSR
jgi:hypothetical protein